MKKILVLTILVMCIMNMSAKTLEPIKLSAPQTKGGKAIMEAFNDRRSDREYSSKELSIEDISNLLWAACGINRPDGRRTSPTARNMQEIDVYLLNKDGAYLYVPQENLLRPIYTGDLREALANGQDFVKSSPICLLIVGDVSKFGEPNDRSTKMMFCDGGIVSQNINMFCAGHNLATVTRGMMDEKVLRNALKLTDTQYLILNNPVGYKK